MFHRPRCCNVNSYNTNLLTIRHIWYLLCSLLWAKHIPTGISLSQHISYITFYCQVFVHIMCSRRFKYRADTHSDWEMFLRMTLWWYCPVQSSLNRVHVIQDYYDNYSSSLQTREVSLLCSRRSSSDLTGDRLCVCVLFCRLYTHKRVLLARRAQFIRATQNTHILRGFSPINTRENDNSYGSWFTNIVRDETF